MRKTSLFAKLLVLALVLSLALTACSSNSQTSGSSSPDSSSASDSGSGESGSSEELEPVTLEWYTNVNAVQPDSEMVMAEAQRYIQEKLNATVNFHLYDWGDYSQTLPTMLNAGMNLDIVFAGGGVSYQGYAKKNAFLALDDYIDEYLPKTKAAMPDSAWDGVTVNGHIYGIPAEKDFGTRENLEANQTLIDDLGVPFPDGKWNTAYDLIDWLYDCKEARDAKYPELASTPIIKQPSFGSFYYVDYIGSIAVTNIPGVPGIDSIGDTDTVFNIYATDEYRQRMKTIRQLVVDGIAPFEDNFDPDDVHRQNGELLGWFGSGLLSLDENANDPYYKTALYVSNVTTLTTGGYTVGPQTVSAKCENPERALMVLELVNNDQYLATTLRFGVEGEHWTDENNDNIIEDATRNADTANRGWWSWYGWQWGGLFVSKVPVGNPSNFSELIMDFNKTGTPSDNVGFVLDTTNITNEIAACSNVISEFDGTLSKGQNDNVDELVDEFVAKLEANGSQKIVDEAQAQLDAWKAANA